MVDDSPHQLANGSKARASAMLQWLVLGVIFLTAWTLLCAHAPARIKLIGVFAIGYGLAAGLVLKQLARFTMLQRPRLIAWLTCLLVASGQVALGVESHRLYTAELRRALEIDKSSAALALMLRTNAPPDEPIARRMFDDMQETLGLRTRFSSYLARRLSPFGQWSSPWPEVFWYLEIAASAATAAWIASRPMKTETVPSVGA